MDVSEPSKMGLEKHRKIAIWAIILLASIGFVAILIATRWGIGVTPDSIAYIGGARSMLEGEGFSMPGGSEITHYTPFYSITLSMVGLFGLEPMEGTRWLNALILAANIFLVGLILMIVLQKSFQRYIWISIFGAFLILTSVTMLEIHTMAWTESLFILLGLSGFVVLSQYFTVIRWSLLVTAAILMAAAFLTRYAGVALVFTGALGVLLFSQQPFRKRLLAAFIFGCLSVLPMLVWILRNLSLAGTATNREFTFHPFSRTHLWETISTFSSWMLIPDSAATLLKVAPWLVVLLGGLLYLFLELRRAEVKSFKQLSAFFSELPNLIKLFALYVPIYGLTLLFTNSFLNTYTPLDGRILSPIYIPLLTLVLFLVVGLLSYVKKGTPIGYLAIVLGVTFLIFHLFNGINLVSASYNEGLGFNSLSWHQSETLGWVRNLPDEVEVKVYSNAPEAVYVHTSRPAYKLPRKFRSINQEPNASYLSDLSKMRDDFEDGEGIVVYFDLSWRTPPQEELQVFEELNLHILTHETDGTIYVSDSRN